MTEKLGRTLHYRYSRPTLSLVLCFHRHRCGNLSARQGGTGVLFSKTGKVSKRRRPTSETSSGAEDATARSRFHSVVLSPRGSLAQRSATQMEIGPGLRSPRFWVGSLSRCTRDRSVPDRPPRRRRSIRFNDRITESPFRSRRRMNLLHRVSETCSRLREHVVGFLVEPRRCTLPSVHRQCEWTTVRPSSAPKSRPTTWSCLHFSRLKSH